MTKGKFMRHHIHSVGSERDGLLKIKDIVEKAAAAGESFSLTDHGNISMWMECVKVSAVAGVRPALGMEVYLNNHRDRILEIKRAIDDDSVKIDAATRKAMAQERDSIKKNNHLVLVAADDDGFRNLIALNNIGYCDGFYGRPLVTYDDLRAHAKGVVCTSACLASPARVHLPKGKVTPEAVDWVAIMNEIYDSRFFIEVQSNGIPEQVEFNKGLIALAAATKTRLCVGLDSHYLGPDWADTHQDLLLLQDKKTREDLGKHDLRIAFENKKGEVKVRKLAPDAEFRNGTLASEVVEGKSYGDKGMLVTVTKVEEVPRAWVFSTDKLWYKSEAELKKEVAKHHKELAGVIDEACDGNREIDAMVKEYHIDRSVKLPLAKDAGTEMVKRVKLALKAKDLNGRAKEYAERAKFELDVIKDNGFENYFMILTDMMDFARSRKIPMGAARGSGTASLVGYLLGIHRVDPLDLRWGPLPFARFLSGDRSTRKVIVENNKGEKMDMPETLQVKVKRDGKTITIPAREIQVNDTINSMEELAPE